QVAAQVLGLRDIDGHGRGGIEEFCEGQLRGTPGQRILTRDALGRVIDVEIGGQKSEAGSRKSSADHTVLPISHLPTDGQNIVLTLDTVIQLFAERALDRLMAIWQPASCCAIVLDPHTGDVLAMASRPSFDPNHPELAAEDAWKNRAIADIYEP